MNATTLDLFIADRPATAISTAGSVAARTIRKFLRTPQLVVIESISTAMFLLIFRFVFGGAIDAGPVPYVDYLVPGFVTTTLLFAGGTAAAAVAEDLEAGFFDRLRWMPVSRSALLFGRAVADTAVLTWGLAVTTLVGFLIGFRIHGSPGAALAAFGLLVVFASAFVWVFVWMGLVAGNARAAQGLSLLVFPVTFVSSALVPVQSMPGWLQPIAEHQPMTAMVNAVRSLVLGGPSAAGLSHTSGYWVVISLTWAAGLIAVFAPLARAKFRRS